MNMGRGDDPDHFWGDDRDERDAWDRGPYGHTNFALALADAVRHYAAILEHEQHNRGRWESPRVQIRQRMLVCYPTGEACPYLLAMTYRACYDTTPRDGPEFVYYTLDEGRARNLAVRLAQRGEINQEAESLKAAIDAGYADPEAVRLRKLNMGGNTDGGS